jgi:hypothetical protein
MKIDYGCGVRTKVEARDGYRSSLIILSVTLLFPLRSLESLHQVFDFDLFCQWNYPILGNLEDASA